MADTDLFAVTALIAGRAALHEWRRRRPLEKRARHIREQQIGPESKESPRPFFEMTFQGLLVGQQLIQKRRRRLSSMATAGTPSSSGSAVFEYHCSAKYSALDGSGSLATIRIRAVVAEGTFSFPFGSVSSRNWSSVSRFTMYSAATVRQTSGNSPP